MKKVKKAKKVTAVKTKKAAAKVTQRKKVTIKPSVPKKIGIWTIVVAGIICVCAFLIFVFSSSQQQASTRDDQEVLGITLTPVIAKIENGHGCVKITWTKSYNLSYYKIYRKDGGLMSNSKFINVGTANDNTFCDQNAKPSTKYTYKITAVSDKGKETKMSLIGKAFTTPIVPTPSLTKAYYFDNATCEGTDCWHTFNFNTYGYDVNGKYRDVEGKLYFDGVILLSSEDGKTYTTKQTSLVGDPHYSSHMTLSYNAYVRDDNISYKIQLRKKYYDYSTMQYKFAYGAASNAAYPQLIKTDQ